MKPTNTRSTPQELMLWVADIIESSPEEYSQRFYYHGGGMTGHTDDYACSTACCIAGYGAACAVSEGANAGHAHVVARKAFGLSTSQADRLFASWPDANWPNPWRDRWAVTYENDKVERAAIAADLLRHLAEHGPEVLGR